MIALNIKKWTPKLSDIVAKIEPTVLPFVKIKNTFSSKDSEITSSKFAGRPYYSSVDKFPRSSNSERMIPLAQINFAEVPDIMNFPNEGLLQFYVSYDQNLGMNPADYTDNSNFKVIYIPKHEIEINKAITFAKDPIGFPPNFPINFSHSLSFYKDEAPITISDFRCKFFKQYFELQNTDQDLYWNKIAKTNFHKIGGYPHFGQDDPRTNSKYKNHTVQLLQILSTNENNSKASIFHGQRATMHFFITPQDLKALDFNNVLYYWDLY